MYRDHVCRRLYRGTTVNVFFTADTHFNHGRMAELREFDEVEEMNECLIDSWNQMVRPQDHVWHLGDVAMGDREAFFMNTLPHLNGELHLVAGNHDPCWSGHRNAHKAQAEWLMSGFSSVQPFARRKIGRTQVLLSHFPYAGDHTEEDRYQQYRLLDKGLWLLHGHVHEEWQVRVRQINVGVDVWDFFPVPLDTIRGIIER